jgi:hypothetical protein
MVSQRVIGEVALLAQVINYIDILPITDSNDITEILLKVALNSINQPINLIHL